MALPSSMQTGGGFHAVSGVVLGLYPSTNVRLQIESQMATASAAASSLWRRHLLPATTYTFIEDTFSIPFSTKTYYFRARHLGVGYTSGPYTTVVNAKPDFLTSKYTPRIQAVEPSRRVYLGLSTAAALATSTVALPKATTKRLRTPAQEFLAKSTAHRWSVTSDFMQPTAVAIGTTIVATAPFILPTGCTITQVRMYAFRRATVDKVAVDFMKMTAGGGAPAGLAQATLTASTAALATWAAVPSTAMSLLTSTNFFYAWQARVVRQSTQTTAAAIAYVDAIYTMPKLSLSY